MVMQFIDQARIAVQAGRGGDGIVAFRREKYVPAGGPSGGDGGRGADVWLVADANLQTLLDFKYKRSFDAPDGRRGGPNRCTGASGNHNHSVNADAYGNDTTRLGLVYISNNSEQTPSSGDSPGQRWEMAIFNKPAAMPMSGDHSHSVSVSGTTNNTGAAETRPENMSVVYFIKY